MAESGMKKHEFQAEVKQLLDIVVHSLYTDKEVFVRELVSNASDALEKLRHIKLTEKDIFDENLDLEIEITTDDKANKITIKDFGVGMTEDELVENLGTIAHSGSKAFLEAAKKGEEINSNLIGQFGVGFYSAFMVAKKVEVFTHHWKNDGKHLRWVSDGSGTYEVSEEPGQRRGCKIVVHLKDEDKEFAEPEKIKGILTRYSSFVQFPIKLNGEQVNTVQAIWMRNKNEIKDEEYTEFYKFQGNAFDEPRYTLHFSADAPLAINALLFVPQENTERFGLGRVDPGVSLYCKKVLIDSKPDGLIPEWLRFLKGVVDSDDLPLNISRESMQDTSLIEKLNKAVTNRLLKFLEEKSKKETEKYEEFYKMFGVYLKEGIATDFTNREQLAKLIRYESSHTEAGKLTSLTDYVSRMGQDQKEIYYLYGPSREVIENSPQMEAFKANKLEVLYLLEPVDEFVMNNIGKFEEKDLVSADSTEVKLDDVKKESDKDELESKAADDLCKWINNELGDKVKEVNISRRLVDSPVIALNADKVMTPSMRKIMKSINKEIGQGDNEINLEINPNHGLIKNLSTLKDSDKDLAKLVVEQLYDNALIAAGFIEDPRSMVNRTYELLERVSVAS
ncbi:MAG: molecular chaperone HtpG [Candidatus Dadabacteria bacterium]|nr:molecular chaperone HtpG [Candidatus Dadabacteria bacterium]NIS08408.1 molecular chaperone HtpG [Candidatus Dadabacteria bacterium]NIV41327.1 molecular chaperone HtpG [Candidatus Dadabacteria bacterium]NIY22397.1 molecular chaperone HtpG [Candidatus Dadabacteria bacterium]